MNATATTRLLRGADRDDPHVQLQLLDDTWLLTIFAVLLAVALPRFVNAFDIAFGTASMGVLVLSTVYLALTTLAGRARVRGVWRTRGLAMLHALGVIVMGFIWQHGGGLQNPAFLVAFALPVIGASFISRWQPYLTAALAILVAGAVALIQAAELRWFVAGLGVAGEWLASFSAIRGAAASTPLPGFYAPFGYAVVLLEVFAILVFACAVAAEYLGTVFARLGARVAAAEAQAERGQELSTSLIEQLPVPAFLIEADTRRVICASERAISAFCAAGAPPAGSDFLEAVRFSYPEVVQEIISGEGGVSWPCMIRVADRLRATEVRVQHVAHQGRLFALVAIEDRTEAFCLKATFDAADYAALVIDSLGRVMGFNTPALALFPRTEVGAQASRFLAPSGSGARWWESRLAGRRKLHVEILQRVYQVTSSTVALPGEEESIYVVTFIPAARIGAAGQAPAEATPDRPSQVQRQ